MRQLISKKWKKLNPRLKIVAIPFLLVGIATIASFVFAYGPNDNKTGLVLDIDFSQDNYNSGTRTFTDKSGNGNNGISSNNAVFVNDKYGRNEKATHFNGSNDYVIVNNVDINNPEALTISAWFRKDGEGSTYECVLHQSTNYTIGNSSFWLGVDSADNFTATIGAVTGVGWQAGQTNIKPVIGEWNHLLASWDGSVVKVYINGEYIKQYNLSTYTSLATPVRMGASSDGISYQFNGSIQNTAIYTRAFSAEEVKQLYNDSKPKMQSSSLEKGLIGYWPLDGENYNASDNRVTDKSAYANHGTNYGATLTFDRFGRENGAMDFNGIDNKISINYPNPVNQTSVTAWFKRNGIPAGGYHIITGGSNIEISINEAGGYIRTGVVTNTQGRKVFNSGSGLTDGDWHQVSMTYDGYNLKSFIDGEETASNPVSGNLTGIASEIGRYLSNSYDANGSIADVRIYNRAISGEEIKAIYDQDNNKTTASSLNKGLILDMPLTSKYTKSNTVGSEIMTDNTPYSRDGQNHGAIISDGANFIGTNTYIEHQAIAIDKNHSWSFSMWQYKPTGSAQTWQGFIGDTMGVSGGYWMFHPSLSWYQDYYDDGTGAKAYGSMYTSVDLGDEIPYDEWYMLTVTYNGSDSKLSIYVNGDLKTSPTATWSPRPVSKFTFKTIGSGSSRYFDGKLSDVKIYDRVLSNTEVQSLYDQGRGKNGAILNGLQ